MRVYAFVRACVFICKRAFKVMCPVKNKYENRRFTISRVIRPASANDRPGRRGGNRDASLPAGIRRQTLRFTAPAVAQGPVLQYSRAQIVASDYYILYVYRTSRNRFRLESTIYYYDMRELPGCPSGICDIRRADRRLSFSGPRTENRRFGGTKALCDARLRAEIRLSTNR